MAIPESPFVESRFEANRVEGKVRDGDKLEACHFESHSPTILGEGISGRAVLLGTARTGEAAPKQEKSAGFAEVRDSALVG